VGAAHWKARLLGQYKVSATDGPRGKRFFVVTRRQSGRERCVSTHTAASGASQLGAEPERAAVSRTGAIALKAQIFSTERIVAFKECHMMHEIDIALLNRRVDASDVRFLIDCAIATATAVAVTNSTDREGKAATHKRI
jgi:hypothetical protein